MRFGDVKVGQVFWFRDRRYSKLAVSMAEVADPGYPEEEGWGRVFLAETEVEEEKPEAQK